MTIEFFLTLSEFYLFFGMDSFTNTFLHKVNVKFTAVTQHYCGGVKPQLFDNLASFKPN